MMPSAYIVESGSWPEDRDIEGVFLSEEKAEAYADEMNSRLDVNKKDINKMGVYSYVAREVSLEPKIEVRTIKPSHKTGTISRAEARRAVKAVSEGKARL